MSELSNLFLLHCGNLELSAGVRRCLDVGAVLGIGAALAVGEGKTRFDKLRFDRGANYGADVRVHPACGGA